MKTLITLGKLITRALRVQTLAALALAGPFVASVQAHNLDQRFTYINFDPETLDMMRARAQAGIPTLQAGDTISLLLKSTPGPGTDTGVGGYMTYYLPDDKTFQVTGAQYVAPNPTRPGYFIPVPIKGQSIIAEGSGSIGAASTPGLAGLNLGPNLNGVTEAAVAADGTHRGTIAGVYADTGIFYSTSPKTAWDSWANGTRPQMPGGGQYPVLLKNNSGDEMRPRTYWDASQLIAYGLAGPHSPALDPNGRGNAPWGLANVVAGPDSGYAWDFNLDEWVAAGYPGYSDPALKATVDQVGPWQRIKYPGSQKSLDQAGLDSAALGYAGTDASNIGMSLSAENPLPMNTTALRFSVGMLELGRSEVVRVELKILKELSTCPFPVHGDAFGGDAGGEQGGKDHLWRYYDPTDEVINLCGGLQKSFSDTLVVPGATATVTLTYFNGSHFPASNLTVTDPLPPGMTYVAGSSKVDGILTPPSGTAPMAWALGYVEPYGMRTITFDVLVSKAGDYVNVATANSDQGTFNANDTLRSAYDDLLSWHKTVSPSAVAPGQTVNYTITIQNDGTGHNGVDFVVTEYLPEGFTYQSMVGKQINGGLLSDSQFSVNAAEPAQPIFTISQGIDAGKSLVLTFKVLVGADVSPGIYYNFFKMTYEGKTLTSPPDAPVTVGGGKIGDTLWRDWDGDGVQDADEEGIEGVTLELHQDNGTVPGEWDAGDTLLASQITSPEGFYSFEGLTNGDYIVTVDTSATGLAEHSNTGDPDGTTPNQSAVTLSDNSGIDLIDFGYQPGGSGSGTASIGDKVFEDKDADGSFGGSDTGIDGVTVNLYEDSNGNGDIDPADQLVATATTTATGDYLFSGLAAGLDYIVDVVESDPDLTAHFSTQNKTYFATTAGDYAISDLSGASLDNDFGFQAVLPVSLGDTVFFDNNSDGLYTAGTDSPISGVKVSLYFDANGDGAAQSGELVSAQTTDGSGQYLFDGLSPERYLVVVDSASGQIPGGSVPVVEKHLVTLSNGENYLDADFPFVNIFSKTVDKASAGPGDILTYSINLNLPGNTLYQGLQICDPLPGSDVTFVAASAGAVVNGGYAPAASIEGNSIISSGDVKDAFELNAYNNNDGTANWSTSWVETNDNDGKLQINGGILEFKFDTDDLFEIMRQADLSGSGAAVLTLDYTLQEVVDGSQLALEASNDGGANWTNLDTYTKDTTVETKSYDLISLLGSVGTQTQIRFRKLTPKLQNKKMKLDNVEIIYSKTTTTSIAVSPKQIGSGGTATVTMTLGSDVAMTNVIPSALTPVVTGGATAVLASGPTPVSSSIPAGGTTTFSWTYTVSDGAAPAGEVKFTGSASGTLSGAGSHNLGSATSATSQVIPADNSSAVCWELGSHTAGSDGFRIAGADIYAFRGDGDGTDREFWLYDPGNGTWNSPTDPTDYGFSVKAGGALTTDGTYVYGLEGNGQKVFQRYDPGADSWTTLAPTPDNIGTGAGLAYHAANGKIYATRGGGQKRFYEFTPGVPGSWLNLSEVSDNIGDGGALVSAGAYLYATRGDGQKTFWRYDPGTNTWLLRADTPDKVDDGGAMVVVGGYIYALQGKTDTFWRYDILNNSWATMAAAPGVVGPGGSLTAVGNTIFALQGNSTILWRYSINSGTWTQESEAPADAQWGAALVDMGTTHTYETSLRSSRSIVGSGQQITLTYTVLTDENVTGFTAPASLNTTSTGGAYATLAGGPSPAGPIDLTAGLAQSFTYTYTITAGTPPSDVTFLLPEATAGTSTTFPGGVTWPASSTHNVITMPELTMQVKVVDAPTGVLAENTAFFTGNQSNDPDYCYVLADESGAATDNDVLLLVHEDGTVERIGATGTTHAEELIFSPDYSKLYTTNRDPGVGSGSDSFGTLDMTTGAFSPINRLASASNPLEGSLGNFSVLDVDAMSFDPVTGKLYAVSRRESGSTNTLLDLLFVINPVTGQHVEDAFGIGVDYVVLRTDLLPTAVYDVDGMAFRPGTSELYAIANTSVSSGSDDRLVTINLTTGAVTDIGRIQRASDDAGIDDVEGLNFSSNGILHATTGTASAAGMANSYWLIDPQTAKASLTGFASLNPISDGGDPLSDFEGLACFSDDLPISASDQAVTSLKGAIGDLVWSDINGDGNYDPTFDIIGGKIDTSNSGGIDGSDDAVIGSVRIIDGMLDLDGDGSIGTGDDGTFQGIGVVDGFLQGGTTVFAEQGISNVRVYVDADDDGTYDSGELSTMTDATGSYWLYGFDAGNYIVRYDPDTTPSGYVSTTPVRTSITLPLDNSQDDTADFGLQPALPSGVDSSIGDLVWYDLDGDGTFSDGDEPISDVTVKLYLDLDASGTITTGDLQVGSDVTDSDGNYLFTGLNAGNYLVLVDEADQDFPLGVALTNSSPAQPNPEAVTLGVAENNRAVDFGYGYTASIGDFVWYDNNGNGIYEPGLGENGVSGAYVLLYKDINGNGVFDGDTDVQVGAAPTQADGSYLLDNLAPGTYFVKVYEQSVLPEGGGAPTLLPTTDERITVDLDPGEVYTDADFGFKSGSFFEGHVFWDINHNSVFEPMLSGAPESGLADITVWIDENDDGILDWTDGDGDGLWDAGEGERWTETDADGEYKFFVTEIGDYLVHYDINDPDIPADLQGTVAETTPTSQNVHVSVLGEEISDVDFGRDNVGQVGDLIFGDRGASGAYDGPATDPGLAGVVVELYADTDLDGLFDPASDAYLGSTVTDADGKYLFSGLADGAYFANVLEGSLPLPWKTLPTVDPDAILDGTGKATVTGGATVVTMDFGYPPQQPGSIGGTVFDDDGAVAGDGLLNGTDTGIAGVTINLYDLNGMFVTSTVTDANGAYRFDGLRPGNYTVEEVNPTGYTDTLDQAGLPADELNNTDTTDNQIPVTVTAGAISGNNHFLDDTANGDTYLVDISGQLRNDTDADGNLGDSDPGIGGATIQLFKDLNGDGLTPLLNVIDGRIDLDGDGLISTADTGTLFGLPIFGGQVDVNNDGVLDASDILASFNGAAVVAGNLDIVPGGSAADDDGSIGSEPLVGTTTTDGSGNYAFTDLTFGDYVAVETDPASAFSTADVAGANDNQVAVALSYGGSTGNDFLDSLTGTVGGHLYADSNGNGTQDVGESDLAGVDVLIQTSDGKTIIVSTDGNGDWTATVAPGTVSAVVVESDPQFVAEFPEDYIQTEGSNPTTVIAVAGTDTPMGNDGYFDTYDATNPASITGIVFNDDDLNGFGGADTVVPGVIVRLYLDINGDKLVPFYDVVGGLIDINGGGVDGTDDGTVSGYSIIDGGIDIDGDGAITAADDGYFDGVFVKDGQLDLDGSGTVDASDAGQVAGEPLVATTVTSSDGSYSFNELTAAGYVAVESDPVGATSVDDRAAVTEFPGAATDNQIGVVLSADEDSVGNDFLDSGVVTYTVSGTVFNDTDDTSTFSGGDTPMANVSISLYSDLDGNGWLSPDETALGPIATTTTDANGDYSVSGQPAGSYVVTETDPSGAISITDFDGIGANGPNAVSVTITASDVTDIDFLDGGYPPASTTGYVLADTDNDDVGDDGQEGVELTLYTDPNGDGDPADGTAYATTTTAADGSYSFTNLAPGPYVVAETQPADFASVSDEDSTVDITGSPVDATNSDTTDDLIPVNLALGETDTGNDFVEEQDGTVTGHLYLDTNGNGTQDGGEPNLANVDVLITDSNGDSQTVTTDAGGNWTATVPPGATTADVDESDPDYPTGATQTEGADPTTVTAVAGTGTDGGTDGYYIPADLNGHLYEDTNGNGTQDAGEPNLANVDVLITDSNGDSQTVTTDAGGNWTATVPPGNTTANVDETDPDFPTGATQTEGTDPTSVTAVAGTDTDGGTDGYDVQGTVTGHLYIDLDGDGTQDGGEPNLADVDVLITDANGVEQTVTTDSGGNWTATVPPGTTTADVDETDPDYPVDYAQTEGDDPTTVTAVTNTEVDGGNDGYYLDLDSDDDGIPDTTEVSNNCDGDGDTDGDGVPDILDLDSDGDGIFDIVEAGNGALDSDLDGRVDSTQGNNGLADALETAPDSGVINYVLPDRDGDLRPDHLDLDSDNDSISDVLEYGNAALVDVANDGIADGSVSSEGTVPFAGSTAPVDSDSDLMPDYLDWDSNKDGMFDIVDNGFGSLDINLDGMIDDTTSGDCDGIPDILDPKDEEYGWFPEMGCTAWNLNNEDDTDGDVFPVDQEYAFGGDPELGDHLVAGTSHRAGMTITKNATGGIDISYVRPQGRFDASIVPYVSHDPRDTDTWTPVYALPTIVSNGDTTETVTWSDIHEIDDNALVTRDRGFVRLMVETPCNPAGSWTLVQGWCRESIVGKHQTYGVNFSSMPVFTGVVDSAVDSTITLARSGKGQNLAAYLAGGVTCFIEFTDGPAEGHRIDIVSGGVDTFGLNLASVNNTTGTLPASLADSHFVVRKHDTLGGIYPNSEWNMASSPGSADQVLLFNGAGYDTYYNLSNLTWVLQGGGFTSRNPLVIAPGTGMMIVHANPNDVNEMLSYGDLRYNDFKRPLYLGSKGLNFMELGYPFDATPASLNMDTANGFVKASSPGSATQILNWLGDTKPNTNGWETNFLLTASDWYTQGDLSTQTTNSPLFRECRSTFVLVRQDNLTWTHPLPWTPAPWLQP